MADGYQRIMDKIHEYATNSPQVLGTAAMVTLGAVLLIMTGLSALTVVVLAPILILLSPVLIPVGTMLFVTVAGIFSAGLFVLAFYFGVSWFYKYLYGRRPSGSDQVDYAYRRIVDTASHVKDYARGYGGYLQGNRQDAKPGA